MILTLCLHRLRNDKVGRLYGIFHRETIGLIGFGNGHLFQKAQVSWSEAVVLRDESHGKIPVILFPVAVVLLEAIETIQ